MACEKCAEKCGIEPLILVTGLDAFDWMLRHGWLCRQVSKKDRYSVMEARKHFLIMNIKTRVFFRVIIGKPLILWWSI